MARRPLSSSTWLTVLLFTAIFLPALALLGFMQVASSRTLLSQQEALVDELADDMLASYADGGPAELVEAIGERIAYDPHGGAVFSYRAPSGLRLAGNVLADPGLAPQRWAQVILRRSDETDPVPVLVDTRRLPDGSRLLVGHVMTGADSVRAANAGGLLLAVLFAGPLSLGLAFLLLRIIERRATRIATITRQFGAGDLSQRVPQAGSGDAFDRLAQALNAMLDRISELVGELRLVTDGLAHDLRSPVSRLQTAVEQAAEDVPEGPAADSLQRARTEAAALQAMLGTSLQISRAEAGIGRDRFTHEDIGALLADMAELFAPIAEEQGVTIVCGTLPGLFVAVHRELLSQAVGNLVDNALSYAEGATRIGLSARRDGDFVRIEVSDDGPGIPAARHGEALRRFGRLDPSRHRPGSGLGLSLAAATANLHGGTLALEDNEPGLRVVITLASLLQQQG